MKTDYVLIGERIKFWRQQRNLTQEQLAETVELTPGFISLILKQINLTKNDTLYILGDEWRAENDAHFRVLPNTRENLTATESSPF